MFIPSLCLRMTKSNFSGRMALFFFPYLFCLSRLKCVIWSVCSQMGFILNEWRNEWMTKTIFAYLAMLISSGSLANKNQFGIYVGLTQEQYLQFSKTIFYTSIANEMLMKIFFLMWIIQNFIYSVNETYLLQRSCKKVIK